MRKSVLSVVFVLALTLPALAGDEPDCKRWAVDGFHPGMEFTAALALAEFAEDVEHRDPLGYGRFLSGSRVAGGIEIHVDLSAEPQRVIGVTIIGPKMSHAELVARWGQPSHDQIKANFHILSWWDDLCGVSVRANTEMSRPDVVLAVALSSNASRSEYQRRKREALDTTGSEAAAEPTTDE